MRKTLFTVLAVLFATAASATVTYTNLGTAAPPATLGGFTVSAIDSIPGNGTILTTLTDSVAKLTFSASLTAGTVPTTWATWSHSATPRILEDSGATSLSFTISPNALAFHLYVEPTTGGVSSITVTAYNGSTVLASGTAGVNSSSGATGFGFYSNAGEQITKIGITAPAAAHGFAIGELAMATGTAVTVDTSPAGLGVTVDSTSYTAPQSFSWQSGSSHTIATTSPQTGTGTQYVFQSWSDAGAMSHLVTAPGSPTTYTASFQTQYYLTTTVNPSGQGSISPASGYFNAGTSVNVSAASLGNGLPFLGFSGDLTGTTDPQSLLVDGPKSVTANFAFITAIPTLDWLGIAALAALLAILGLVAVRRGGA